MTSRTDISDHILRTPKEVSESSHSGCENLTDSVLELSLMEGLEIGSGNTSEGWEKLSRLIRDWGKSWTDQAQCGTLNTIYVLVRGFILKEGGWN